MRKSILLTVIFFAAIHFCNAQGKPPGIKWEKILGRTGADVFDLRSALIDRDGQYIVGGASFSNDGDVSGNHPPSQGTLLRMVM